MNRSIMTAITGLSLLTLSLNCFAMNPECSNPTSKQMHLICTDNNKGKWIKHSYKYGEEVYCAGGNDYDEYLTAKPKTYQLYAGSNSETYFQCRDKSCQENKLIGTDNFNVTQQGDEYTSTPRVYIMKIDDNYGADCRW